MGMWLSTEVLIGYKFEKEILKSLVDDYDEDEELEVDDILWDLLSDTKIECIDLSNEIFALGMQVPTGDLEDDSGRYIYHEILEIDKWSQETEDELNTLIKKLGFDISDMKAKLYVSCDYS